MSREWMVYVCNAGSGGCGMVSASPGHCPAHRTPLLITVLVAKPVPPPAKPAGAGKGS